MNPVKQRDFKNQARFIKTWTPRKAWLYNLQMGTILLNGFWTLSTDTVHTPDMLSH